MSRFPQPDGCIGARSAGAWQYPGGNLNPRAAVEPYMKRLVLVACSCLTLVYGSDAEYLSATHKIKLIESDRLSHGARVRLTAAELSAYAKQEIAETYPSGVWEPRLVLASGGATGSAWIDLGKVRRAQGHPPGWLMSKLLDGERPVEVTARISSGGGRATVDVESVRISGVTIDGRLLDFLIQYYLLPNYPDAKVGKPFELAHGVDRFEVRPAGVDVVIH
jgi:hypothetical protein